MNLKQFKGWDVFIHVKNRRETNKGNFGNKRSFSPCYNIIYIFFRSVHIFFFLLLLFIVMDTQKDDIAA